MGGRLDSRVLGLWGSCLLQHADTGPNRKGWWSAEPGCMHRLTAVGECPRSVAMPCSPSQALDYVRSTFEDRRSIFEFSLSWDPAAYDAAAAATDHQLLPAAFRRDMVQQRRWQRQVRGAGRRLCGGRGRGGWLSANPCAEGPCCPTLGDSRGLPSCSFGCCKHLSAFARWRRGLGALAGHLDCCGAAQNV